MAYTFTDYYRTVRWVLRLNALLVGLGFGLLLLIYPASLLDAVGIRQGDVIWTARVGGSCLLGLGVGLFLAANEQEIRLSTLLTAIISNGGITGTLLIAYLRGELQSLNWLGTVILIVLFVTSLLTTTLPMAYLRGSRRYE